MLVRNIIRKIAPIAHTVYTSFTPIRHCYLEHNIVPLRTIYFPAGTSSLKYRLYSQDTNAILPVVDFDYVKRATTQNDIVIIDVREPDEIKEHGKIPNSINIPLGSVNSILALSDKEFRQTLNRAKPKENTELIFYCMIGKRSGKAQQNAQNLGFKNAKNYLGSWTDWAVKNQ